MLALSSFGGLSFSALDTSRKISLSPKQGELLAFIVTRKSKRVRKEKILSELWPERSDRDARHGLNTCLWEIRKILKRHQAKEPIEKLHVTRDEIYYAGDARVDSLLFSEAVESFLARFDAPQSETEVDQAFSDVLDAISTYQGPFLEGYESEWISPERARLLDLYCRSCRLCTRLFAKQRRIENAIECARRVLSVDPFHEGAHLDLIRLLALNGQRAAALRQYGYYSDILKEDLDIEPLEEATVLRTKIVTGHLFDNFEVELCKTGQAMVAPMG